MYYLFIMRQVICWFVYIGKNPRFTAFLDSKLHTRLAIVTENALGLAFPPRNLPQKNSFRSVHVLFSYRGNNIYKQTNAGDYIIPRESFRADNERVCLSVCLSVCPQTYLSNHMSGFRQFFGSMFVNDVMFARNGQT